MPSLPRSFENPQQLGVDEFVAADHIAGFERVVTTLEAADDAAGFAHDDLARGRPRNASMRFAILASGTGGHHEM